MTRLAVAAVLLLGCGDPFAGSPCYPEGGLYLADFAAAVGEPEVARQCRLAVPEGTGFYLGPRVDEYDFDPDSCSLRSVTLDLDGEVYQVIEVTSLSPHTAEAFEGTLDLRSPGLVCPVVFRRE